MFAQTLDPISHSNHFIGLLRSLHYNSDKSGSNTFGPGRIGSIFCGSGWVRVRVSLVWVWKISPKNMNFFSLCQKKSPRVGSRSTRVKEGSTSYLLWVKSMLGLGQGPSLLLTFQKKFNLYPKIFFDLIEILNNFI